jgi:SAM-dependent methyltransferase
MDPMSDGDTLRGSYGIDSPLVVAIFAVVGVIAGVFAVAAALGGQPAAAIGPAIAAVFLLTVTVTMVRSSRVAKRDLWVGLLDDLDLTGSEDVLDLGCGRGLVTVLAARRVPDGAVTGIDIWRARDQSGNKRVATERNVETDGVADRVEIIDADMVQLPFENQSFDVVTAGLALHHVALSKDRKTAVGELVRVLRPGGRVIIVDVGPTNELADTLEAAKLADVDRSKRLWAHYPPVRVVTARKRGAGGAGRAPGSGKKRRK